VTQESWEDVWLSEGFATWLAGKIMDEEQPPWRKHLNAINSRERIMAADDGPKTRPVRMAMHGREDLNGVYTRIVYDKGASILLMLEGWLGEENVQKGLRAYLSEHRFGNATTKDLEEDLRKAAGQDPTKVMDSFLNTTGVPSIHGDVRCQAGAAPVLEIERDQAPQQYTIPVCWRADGLAGQTCTMLDAMQREVAFPKGAACPSWFYLNAGGTGYYRTQWTSDQEVQLAEHGLSELSGAEQLTLIYDLRVMLLAGKIDATAILLRLAEDPEPVVARAASDALQGK